MMKLRTSLTSLLAVSTSISAFRSAPHISLRLSRSGSRRSFAQNMSLSSSTESLLSCPTVSLRDKTPHPVIGFGTYKVGFIPASASSAVSSTNTDTDPDPDAERTASECVSDAISVGYRFLECAQFYGNESEVGKAIQASKVPRSEFFICSKVWTTTIEKGEAAIRSQLEKTLEDLGTDYVDLYLIHWPVPGKHVEAYKTLEKLHSEGKIKNIGVSNYAVEDYQELLDNGVTVKPAVNQIEINPFLYRKNTIEFFKSEGVVLQSYRSLRDGKAFTDPTIVKIAEEYGRSPAQILGRWCVQKGFIYMVSTVQYSNREAHDTCLLPAAGML